MQILSDFILLLCHYRATLQDLMTLLGALFTAVFFLGASNGSAVQPIVDIERTVFYRERAAGMYSALPYACAQVHNHFVFFFFF